MTVVGSDLIWRVEVEMPASRRWHLLAAPRLRRAVETASNVVRVRNRRPWLERLVLRSLPPTIVVEVVADSPAAAMRTAEQAVSRSLAELRQASDVRAWIVSTDGERPPSGA
jgi:hypothetical protein